ncbi:MAG TPA: RagB/SusD family nutrient uptake outer membrane protein [Gemmatimonadaceae bacterium]|nr:RagB/SusD family nutrient uptake outer membrane protein [Gemmatimonadaceae bacterium]
MTTRRTLSRFAPMVLLGWTIACSPDRIIGNAELPPNVPDPGSTKTPAGAVAAYRGALARLAWAYGSGPGSAVAASGLLSDELQAGTIGQPIGVTDDRMQVDSRVLPEYVDPVLENGAPGRAIYFDTYRALQAVRGQTSEARGLLTHYAPDSLHALTGHLYAIQGYAEVLLADLFCSGVPLSTLDFDGDYTLAPGSSTADVYRHAITMFDSALTLAADSERFVDMARVGKGRALLALGEWAAAAQAVAGVPDGFSYAETYPDHFSGTEQWYDLSPNFARLGIGATYWAFSVADREGGDGLDYRSSADPRTVSDSNGTNDHGVTVYHPEKYSLIGDSPIVLADWVEARLIEAEAALQAGDVTTWLAKLNHLRETAIVPALPDTTDPGTPDARVDLTFRERAFWLFLTAHRQGDLRRLVRQYGRQPNEVFPVGPYRGVSGSYGADVTLPIPAEEIIGNPNFHGCMSRGA